jgi:hypothetical protein
MKFYQNKTNGEIIGVTNMRHLIKHPTTQSEKLGYNGYSYSVIYDMIHPNCLLPNGLTSFSIEHTFLTKNYKRIRREIAFAKYPKFRQYTYQDLIAEAKLKKVDKLEVLENQEY